ncbi:MULTISPECIES: N-formylglutamate amidohydrolase [unclassified Sinorhizobium]|uniref:N-formylglutamate amidohydrolase n=1 Tax=unclassified Sinorhizobium TaxID=2613772 RepID=UPI003523E7D5
MDGRAKRLLDMDEPDPVVVQLEDGRSPFFLTCDHAGRRLPQVLGDLGLPPSEFDRHIAWDIGAGGLSRRLSDLLDASLVEQIYSRLVIDCNRSPSVPSAIPEISELTVIPGNTGLSDDARAMRRAEIFDPYHARIRDLLDRRAKEDRETILVAMHSFTPVFKGFARPWHVGVLYHNDPSFGHILLELLSKEADLVVGDNEPYHISDETDYGIPVHGERRGLPHVELEIRQDLIADPGGQAAWAERLARLLPLARTIHRSRS